MKTNDINDTTTSGPDDVEHLVVMDEVFQYVEAAMEAETRGESSVDGHDTGDLRAEAGAAVEDKRTDDGPPADDWLDEPLRFSWLVDPLTGERLRPATAREAAHSLDGPFTVTMERDVVVEKAWPLPWWRYWSDRFAPVAMWTVIVWAAFRFAPDAVDTGAWYLRALIEAFAGLAPVQAATVVGAYLAGVVVLVEVSSWLTWRSRR
jgi:hypothetical protein